MQPYEIISNASLELDALVEKTDLTRVELYDEDGEFNEHFFDNMAKSLIATQNIVLYWKNMLDANRDDRYQEDKK